METSKEYYYTYYSYEEWGRGYIGSRKCKCFPEKDIRYFGSYTDKTFHPTKKIILEVYETREKCLSSEILLHKFYDVANNPHFANRARQTSIKFCVSEEQAIKNGKKTGKKCKELKIGVCGLTKDDRSKQGKENAKNKIGIMGRSKEKMTEDGRKGGKIIAEINRRNKTGIFGMSAEEKSKSGKKAKQLGLGIHSLTKEQRTENGKKGYNNGIANFTKEQLGKNCKKINNEKWMCLETGFISNIGNVTKYQKRYGIDTSKKNQIGI